MPPKSRASVVPVEPETGRPLSVEGTLLLVETACVGDGVPLVVAMLGVGETIVQLRDEELIEWLEMATQPEVSAVEAILVGETVCGSCDMARLRELVNAPVIALLDARNLQKLIALYKQGVDDVVNKPVHCEELVVRIAAIKKRMLQVPTPGQATPAWCAASSTSTSVTARARRCRRPSRAAGS